MKASVSLLDLPTEVLLLILKSARIPASINLTSTCRRLRDIWNQHSPDIVWTALHNVYAIPALGDAINAALIETQLTTSLGTFPVNPSHGELLVHKQWAVAASALHLWLPRLFRIARLADHAHGVYVTNHRQIVQFAISQNRFDPNNRYFHEHDRTTMYEGYYMCRMAAMAWSAVPVPTLKSELLARRGEFTGYPHLSTDKEDAYGDVASVLARKMTRKEQRRHGMMPKVRTTERLNIRTVEYPWMLQEWEYALEFLEGGPWESGEPHGPGFYGDVAMERDGEKRWESGEPYTEDEDDEDDW